MSPGRKACLVFGCVGAVVPQALIIYSLGWGRGLLLLGGVVLFVLALCAPMLLAAAFEDDR